MKNHFTVCSCHSSEHTLRFVYDTEEKELFTEVYLNQHRSFLKRLVVAVKYIFGYKSKYGHFDCTIMDDEEVVKLKNFLGTL